MTSPINKLKNIMQSLRDPDSGCPWDIEQTFESILPHTIEEAYEVADAIERHDIVDLKDELGDLLFQVVYHSQMASEKDLFTFDDVVEAVTEKMVSRHPHVFGDKNANSADDVNDIWEAQKEQEKSNQGALDTVTRGLPSLLRAAKLQRKAAKTGFEWPSSDQAFEKLEEEIQEFKEANSADHKEEELGDLLFCLVNYARMEGFNAEEALRKANEKFIKRFKGMEKTAAHKNKTLKDYTLDEMLALWQQQK